MGLGLLQDLHQHAVFVREVDLEAVHHTFGKDRFLTRPQEVDRLEEVFVLHDKRVGAGDSHSCRIRHWVVAGKRNEVAA